MSATDILKLCNEVLAASKDITPLPWVYDSRTGCAGIYQVCDETMPKANCFDDVDRFICFYERRQDELAERDWSYIAIAANTAPALAEYIRRLHEALGKIAAGMGNLSLEQIETDVNGINDGKQRAIYLAAFIKIAREALGMETK